MRDFLGMMNKAKELQSKMQQVQEDMAGIEADGASGGGLVRMTVGAKGEIRRVRIDPSLLKPEEAEILEDLLVAAHAEGRGKAEAIAAEKMQAAMGGLQLPPGMKLPF